MINIPQIKSQTEGCICCLGWRGGTGLWCSSPGEVWVKPAGALCSVLRMCLSAGISAFLLFMEIPQCLVIAVKGMMQMHGFPQYPITAGLPKEPGSVWTGSLLLRCGHYPAAAKSVGCRCKTLYPSIHPLLRHRAQALRGHFGLIFDVYFSEVGKVHI